MSVSFTPLDTHEPKHSHFHYHPAEIVAHMWPVITNIARGSINVQNMLLHIRMAVPSVEKHTVKEQACLQR